MLLWTVVYKFLCGCVFISLGCICRSGTAESKGNSVFNFLRNYHTVFHSGCTILHPHQQCIKVPVFPHLCQHLIFFFITPILVGMKWYLIVVLTSISLMTTDVQLLFMCCWPFVYLLWRNVYSDPLPIF